VSSWQLKDEDFSAKDHAEIGRRMSELFAQFTAIANRCGTDGRWRAGTNGAMAERARAQEVIAELSRALSTARRQLRAVDARARQRRADCAFRPSSKN
jgi:hypothetical protein